MRIIIRAWHEMLKEYVDPFKYCTVIDGELQGAHIKLEQFTGLKDKSGVKIFEGDIISWGENIELVSFNDCMFQTETSCIDSCMTVVGNINQNPEPMEE